MQVGVSTASLFMRKNNEDALPLFNTLGVKTAEVFLTSFSEYGTKFGEFLAQRKGNVHINSVHALNTEFEPQLFSAHTRVRDDAYFWAGKVLETANALGAKYYTFHGLSRVKRASRSGANDDFAWLGDGFARLTEFCKNRDVTLCLENVEWSTYNRPGVFEKISKQVPDLKGVLDIKQARISEYPYEFYLDEMAEKIAYVHLSDIDENGRICLPGKGIFDLETLIKRLKDVGFDGNLLLEVYNQNYKEEQELKLACDYVNELLDKNNCLSK